MTLEEFVRYIKQSNYNNCLYHFTDADNLESIGKHGILSTEQRENQGIKPCHRGGNKVSHDADKKKGIENFVCLSFTNEHPLAHVAETEGRITNPLNLKINPEILLANDVRFADGVANASATILTPFKEAISSNLIDTGVIYEFTDWRNSEIRERLDKARKYEILVPSIVPVNMIIGKD